VAQKLQELGVARVRPLAGGFQGWRDLHLPLDDRFVATVSD